MKIWILRHRVPVGIAAGAAVAVAAATAAGAATHAGARHAQNTAADSPSTGWRVVPSVVFRCHSVVKPDDAEGILYSVSATGPADAWAAGVCGNDGGTHEGIGQQPTGVVEHWNGRGWTKVRVPKADHYDVIAAHSARDVFATCIPTPGMGGGDGKAVTIHWNGKSWARADAGLPKTGVQALVPFWAEAGGGVFHYSGARWRQVRGPAGFRFPDPTDILNGGDRPPLAADGSGGVWAGGTAGGRPAVAHYDGHRWRVDVLPRIPDAPLVAGLTTGGHALWTVVFSHPNAQTRARDKLTVLRLSGTKWTALPAPPQSRPSNFARVLAGDGRGGLLLGKSLERWDGHRWTPGALPNRIGPVAVAAVPGTTVAWTVGGNGNDTDERPTVAVNGRPPR